ncbi:MAG: tRNA 2-thiouridine(34) synthase MnmA [Candidatus Liptonbacteria bacterium]|nr:tRNA 2-thiouridine(34) synthase MnmA [Candidatus Liptonbacteria bacterium]
MKRKNKVFVGMSGGVDSSVTAFLLKKKDYDVVGVFIRSYNMDGCEEGDAEDARRVAGKLGIPFYVWDFEEEYKKRVVDYMVEGYRRGLTPNPDVMCNKEIKFGLFLEKAVKFGADYVATGHYVRLVSSTNSESSTNKRIKSKFANSQKIRYSLMIAKDKNKDQSYFLWTLTQEQLKHCLFPIGDYQKSEVRKIAKKAGLSTAEKKDSQGICFLGRVRLGDFLAQYIKPKVGQVRLALKDGSYKAIGNHSGAQFYTIGQRHIGMANRGLTQKTNFKPLYVAEKDIRSNTLVVAEGGDNPVLFKKKVELAEVNFINTKTHFLIPLIRANKGYKDIKVLARVRYRQPLFSASLIIHNSSFRLIFDNPQKFVAAGQSAVLYSKLGEMLGGGIIL